MRILYFAITLTVLVMAPKSALADCSCLCLDGAFQPVCTSAEEIAANRGLCQAQAAQGCPSAPALAEPQTYAPPVEGAENCRQAQVYDASTNGYLTAKVCDVRPED